MRTKDRWRVEDWEDEKELRGQKTDGGWRTGRMKRSYEDKRQMEGGGLGG